MSDLVKTEPVTRAECVECAWTGDYGEAYSQRVVHEAFSGHYVAICEASVPLKDE